MAELKSKVVSNVCSVYVYVQLWPSNLQSMPSSCQLTDNEDVNLDSLAEEDVGEEGGGNS